MRERVAERCGEFDAVTRAGLTGADRTLPRTPPTWLLWKGHVVNCYIRGMNHDSAPIEVREQVARAASQTSAILAAFSREGVPEAFLLATCNRLEFYLAGRPPTELRDIADRVIEGFVPDAGSHTRNYWYEHCDRDAVVHLFRVASGLDSLILGEPEVLGQVKRAFDTARQVGSVGIFFNEVFKRCLHVAKRVRTETEVGIGSVSLVSATRNVLDKELGSLEGRRILLLGTGEIAGQVAHYLGDGALAEFYIASRTPERSERMAAEFGGAPVTWPEVPDILPRCDGVVCATSCTDPLLSCEDVRPLATEDRATPFVLVDLGHPRNVDPAVRELPSVKLYALADLKSTIKKNLGRRRAAVPRAERIIDEETTQLAQWHTVLSVVDVVKSFRQHFERIRQQELGRMRSRLTEAEWTALDEASRRILAKFLHAPTLALKSLNVESATDREKLDTILSLFGLSAEGLHDETW